MESAYKNKEKNEQESVKKQNLERLMQEWEDLQV